MINFLNLTNENADAPPPRFIRGLFAESRLYEDPWIPRTSRGKLMSLEKAAFKTRLRYNWMFLLI